MNEPVNVHIQAFRDAFAAAKATTLPGTAYESALLVDYAASLLVAAEADIGVAMREVTQHYGESLQSGSPDLRESVRTGWIALFRRAAAINPEVAKSVLEFMGDAKEFGDLREAAGMVSTEFRKPAPA